MWKEPTHETLSSLVLQGLKPHEIARYYGTSITVIQEYLEKYKIVDCRKYTAPIMEINKPPARKRLCLSCGGAFRSEGNHNRICDGCKGLRGRGSIPPQYVGTAA